MRVFQVEDAWSMDNLRMGTRPDPQPGVSPGADQDESFGPKLPGSSRAYPRLRVENETSAADNARQRRRCG